MNVADLPPLQVKSLDAQNGPASVENYNLAEEIHDFGTFLESMVTGFNNVNNQSNFIYRDLLSRYQ